VLSFEELCARFEAAPHGNKADARCPGPGHKNGDRRKSLSLWHDPERERHNVKCHTGCTQEDVLEAVGLTWRDLVPDRTEHRHSQSRPQAEARYDYHDGAGKLLFQVVRFRPKDFRQRRPAGQNDSKVTTDPDGTRWVWETTGVRRVLYRLPKVLEAVEARRVVFVLEGEKDADNAARVGVDATTSPGGAGKWRPEYADSLAGADVVVVPDNDTDPYPGQKHAADAARSLEGKAARVRVLELPSERNGRPVKDFSDWQAAGGTKAELIRLAEAAPGAGAWLAAWQDRIGCAAAPARGRAGNAGNKPKRGRSGDKGGRAQAAAPPPAPDPEAAQKAAEAARLAAGELWTAPDVLERFYRAAVASGVVGEESNVKVLVLAATSRVLTRPVNVYLRSESSSGKTYTARAVLDLLPPESSYTADGASPRSFVYDERDYRHRTLLLNEVDSFATARSKDGDNAGVGLLRTLADSNEVVYQYTRKEEDGRQRTEVIRKPGPTGVVFTGCHDIDPELTNRCIVLSLDESREQTRAIKGATLKRAAGKYAGRPALGSFHALQRFLQLGAPFRVLIPFAESLSVDGKGEGLRARRDVTTLIALISAHVLLQSGTRARAPDGALVASVDDYRAVFEIAGAVFPAEDTGLTPKQREAVEAVRSLHKDGQRITVKAVCEALGKSRNAANSLLAAGKRAGFLRRTDDGKQGTTAEWEPGDDLPTSTSWLRPPAEVAAMWEREQPALAPVDPPGLVTPLVTPQECGRPQDSCDCGGSAVVGGVNPPVTPLVTPQECGKPQDLCGPGCSVREGVTNSVPPGQGAPSAVSPLILSPSPVPTADAGAPAGASNDVGLCYWAQRPRGGRPAASGAVRRPHWKPVTVPVPPELQEAFEERAAIREHEGGQSPGEAEAGALEDLARSGLLGGRVVPPRTP
jgi:hypothetical protein